MEGLSSETNFLSFQEVLRWKLGKRHSTISRRKQPWRFSLSEKIGMHVEGVYEGELESRMLVYRPSGNLIRFAES